MATLSAKIFKHHKKADGTYNVKICLCHKRQRVFLDTTHHVVDKQLNKKFEIKDQYLITCVNKTLDGYRRTVSEMDGLLDNFTAQTLKEFLLRKDETIDFLFFCQSHLDQMGADCRGKAQANYKTVRNAVIDFWGDTPLPIGQITLDFLMRFERFLRGSRTMRRIDRLGRTYFMNGKPLGDASVHCYLRDLSGFFSAAMAHYNKPSLGLVPIKFNPFDEYKIVEPPETKKRNIKVDDIISIRDVIVRPGSRQELARDMFMFSFYMCGINAVDIFRGEYGILNERLEYRRSKTKNKRKDGAFISIKLVPEAKIILEKYDGMIGSRYSSIGCFNRAIGIGMRELQTLTGVPEITFYWARHTFGNLARNICRKSKDDVALALNHVDKGRKTTDIYLAKDWTIVDEVQAAVLSLTRHNLETLTSRKINVRTLFENIRLVNLKAAI